MNMPHLREALTLGGHRLVAYVTGGGTDVIGSLVKYGGGSSYFLDARVPYSTAAFDQIVGRRPEKGYCSEQAARQLAVVAREQAVVLGSTRFQAMGLGVTAALGYPGQRQGRFNGAYVAIHSVDMTVCHTFEYPHCYSREAQEEALTRDILLALANNVYGDPVPAYGTSHKGCEIALMDPKYVMLDAGKVPYVLHGNGVLDELSRYHTFFPGAFNPLHEGHLAILQSPLIDDPVIIPEVSLSNVEKPRRDWIEVERLIAQFEEAGLPWILTDAATFDEKVEILPNSTFVVGGDTWERIRTPSYYDGDENDMYHIHRGWTRDGARFVIFPRLVNGSMTPRPWARHMHGPLDATLVDVEPGPEQSSTAIRKLRRDAA